MELWKLIILSIIQGISEIFPISSSGHLILLKKILNVNYQGLDLEIFLHLGSLISIIFYYRKDISLLIKESLLYLFSKEKSKYKNSIKLTICLICSTLITGIIGLFLNNIIDKYFSNVLILPFSFLITSLLLFLSTNIKSDKDLNSITIKDAILIGVMQIFGLIPGISRSGSTIVGCKMSKFDSHSSIKYSYLLFIPITFSSFFLKILDFIKNPVLLFPLPYYIISLLVVVIFTSLSLHLFIRKLNSKTLNFFSFYLIIISFIIVYLFYI